MVLLIIYDSFNYDICFTMIVYTQGTEVNDMM